jgi:hypothetical protein
VGGVGFARPRFANFGRYMTMKLLVVTPCLDVVSLVRLQVKSLVSVLDGLARYVSFRTVYHMTSIDSRRALKP